MSEQEDNKELIRRGYEAFSSGDVEAMMSLFADDLEWVQPGDSALGGTYRGKDEFIRFLGILGEKSPTVEVEDLIADGDQVVALTTVRAGGETGHDAEVFTLRDGKTVRVVVHTDTAMMERVYGRKHATAG